ncbi:hypothetical protein BSL78_07690 [Apostichopus japonicus]|uniref:Ig-like domain-containing protein n=1 Tax=Stichopus japonicus TaxID=307972 RepID=A0A2G8L567_STIJA|nr:hypothetical protein BSL78_07690 [Apostichopus japonicus]
MHSEHSHTCFGPEKSINITCANFNYSTGAGNAEICNPVQYVERGNAGTIYCSFREDSHGIYWYDTSDVTEHPMFYLEDKVKSGEGFSSGEFDVHANGSLTINNVSLSHDHNFTVLQLQTADSNPIVLTIQVVVTVHPTLPYPFIPLCNGTRYCYHYAKDSSPFVCFVNKTRPLMQLSWNLRTSNDEHEVVFHTKSIQDGEVFTTLITVSESVVNYINFQLLVCKATPGEASLINEDALLLIELHSPKVNFSEAVVENHPINKTISLPCSIDESLFFVWKRRINGTHFKLLAHGSYGNTVCESNQYSLKSKNALLIPFPSDELEGIYVCFYGNGTDEEMSVYNVSISGK